MTNQEFVDGFDLQFNNISSNKAPGLDTTEMAYFLTEAQKAVVDALVQTVDSAEVVRRNLANLIVRETPTLTTKTGRNNFKIYEASFSEAPIAIIDEDAELSSGTIVKVIPVAYDDLTNVMDNPFRRPNKRRVVRVDLATSKVELVSSIEISTYTVNFIKHPSTFVLEDMSATDCELDESLHSKILEVAVQLAYKSWVK